MSLFDDYLRAIERLLGEVPHGHARYQDLLILQTRLQENVRDTNLYGDTAEQRENRARILSELNRIALETLGRSFNDVVKTRPGANSRRAEPLAGGSSPPVTRATRGMAPPVERNSDDIASKLGHPAWQGIGAIATIILGILSIAVAIIIALTQLKIIDIHSVLP